MIKGFFAGKDVLIGSPKFIITTKKIIVQIPYYSRTVLRETNVNALMTLLDVKSTKQIELRFVRLQYPFLERSILSQYLALNASKYNFLRMKKILFQKSLEGTDTAHTYLPSLSTGVKMELSGRLTTQRSIPRKTVTNAHKGSFTVSNKLDASLNLNQYTSKNKFGTYTMKV